MKNLDKIGGVVIILIGILGAVLRAILTGYRNIWDFIMLAIFIFTIIMGISVLRRK